MTENMAARGEGLAGAISCVKEFIAWATEQIGTSEAHGCAEQAEDALKLLEAAAPPGTAPRHELRTEILRVYVALHFDPEEHGWPRVAGVYSTYEAAESRVEELGCGATQSLHLNKPVRLAVPAATQEQPAGSAQVVTDLQVALRIVGDWKEDSRGLVHVHKDAIRKAIVAALRSAGNCGSPRKVGEDGAQTFEQWWQAEGARIVRTTHCTRYEAMKEAWNVALEGV